jgi:hypothetical protein
MRFFSFGSLTFVQSSSSRSSLVCGSADDGMVAFLAALAVRAVMLGFQISVVKDIVTMCEEACGIAMATWERH